jgi:aminoglycoside phosphotransferase
LNESDVVIKKRGVWNPRCLQLLREEAAARYALQVTPQVVDGTVICFPEIEVSLGLTVLVRSSRIKGRNLLEMIYDPDTQELALDAALVALRALDSADVASGFFLLFGMAYGFVRWLKVAVAERFGVSLLSSEQRTRLNCLVSGYVKPRKRERKVLVHGDLHAGNLLLDREAGSLGFVDLEMNHLGRPVTNFGQLWISFHFADPALGQRFYQRYMGQFSEKLDGHFDSDVRAEVALRCYSLVRQAEKSKHAEQERKARLLLEHVLGDVSFEEVVSS